jgi:hypothetical protein
MPPKRSTPPDGFAAKFLDLNGEKEALKAFYGIGRIKLDGWIEQAIGDEAVATKTIELADLPHGRPAEMLEERDLSPEEWRVSSLTINEWEAGDDLNRQTKLTLQPLKDVVRPARVDGWKPPAPKPRKAGATETTFLVGDHQAPYIDEDFHAATLRWLAEVKPAKGVVGGDGLDLPSVSKYAKTAGWNASVNECVDSFYRVLCDYRSASPDTQWVMLEGNHEARLHAHLMRQFEEGAAIKRAGENEDNVLSVPYLMRLDELGIPYIDNYPHAVHKITPTVGAIHGTIVKKDAGASGHATLMQRGFDVYQFHIHRQGLTPHTWHDIDGEPYTKWACEVGAACLVKEGLNHTVSANWQNGAATATVHKDGTHVPELLQWINKDLCWRGDRW